MNTKSIGEQIRFFRQQSSMTQQELAKRIGVTWEMISRYERGISSPLSRIDLIAEALDVDTIKLLQKNNIPNNLNDSSLNRIPLFTRIPEDFEFLRGSTTYFYSAPDWILEMDKNAFLIDPGIIEIKTIQLKENGPVYISPNTEASDEDMVLFEQTQSLVIDILRNTPPDATVIGVVLAQENRYK